MRGKRSKQYRKLMERFGITFGFREPYQVLIDAGMIQDSHRFKMELAPALERTVHGKVKPMITQCEIRKLYARKSEPGGREAIEVAKSCERRRCGHHPDEYAEPLSALECFKSVVDPNNSGENKHRYVIASQSQDLRRMLRAIRGVPLVYIKRSVMILEPMSDESVQLRAREEQGKLRSGIKPTIGKRKRDETENGKETVSGSLNHESGSGGADVHPVLQQQKKKKRKQPGPKGPNPLSIKKPKKKPSEATKDAQNGNASADRKRQRKEISADAPGSY